jgi:hypothetical protein
MGLLYADQLGEWWAADIDDTCFFCGEAIMPALGHLPAVYWQGASAPIALHGGCARKLGAHLIADAREAELASAVQPWPRRTARVLREALTAAEMRP